MACETPLATGIGASSLAIDLGETVTLTGIWIGAGDGDVCPQYLNFNWLYLGAPGGIASIGPALPSTPYQTPFTPWEGGIWEVWCSVLWGPLGYPTGSDPGPGSNGPNDPPISPSVIIKVSSPIGDPHTRTRPEPASGTIQKPEATGSVGSENVSGAASPGEPSGVVSVSGGGSVAVGTSEGFTSPGAAQVGIWIPNSDGTGLIQRES